MEFGWSELCDDASAFAENSRCISDRLHARRAGRANAVVRVNPHAKAPASNRLRVPERHWDDPWISPVRANKDWKHHDEVLDTTRHRPRLGEGLEDSLG